MKNSKVKEKQTLDILNTLKNNPLSDSWGD